MEGERETNWHEQFNSPAEAWSPSETRRKQNGLTESTFCLRPRSHHDIELQTNEEVPGLNVDQKGEARMSTRIQSQACLSTVLQFPLLLLPHPRH